MVVETVKAVVELFEALGRFEAQIAGISVDERAEVMALVHERIGNAVSMEPKSEKSRRYGLVLQANGPEPIKRRRRRGHIRKKLPEVEAPPPGYSLVKEIAKRLNLSPPRLYAAIKQHHIRAVLADGVLHADESDAKRFVAERYSTNGVAHA